MGRIYSWAKFTIPADQAERFKHLAHQCSEIVNRREPGTLFYEWFLTDDESACVAIDCYADFAALQVHIENVGPLMREILSIAERELEIYGEDPALAAGRSTIGSDHFFAPLFLHKL